MPNSSMIVPGQGRTIRTLSELQNALCDHTNWNPGEEYLVRATTPHGTYTFEIEYTSSVDSHENSVLTLHLREIQRTVK